MSRAGGGRPTVEGALTLDIGRLKREGLLQPGHRAGAWRWQWGNTGQTVAQIEYETDIGEESGFVRVHSITRIDPLGRAVTTGGRGIELVTTVPRFGGRR